MATVKSFLLFLVIFLAIITATTLTHAKIKLDRPMRIQKHIAGGSLKAKQGGSLTYEFYEPSNINPITFRQSGSAEILTKWIFESLLESDVVTGEDIPKLASKWAISKNGKEFTFWIDKRAKWFDGKPVTAQDVKFSFEVFGMKGARSAFKKAKASEIKKIQIINKHVIKFYVKKRLFSNFEFVTSNIILPKHLYYRKDPEKLANNKHLKSPKGSGPYTFESWRKGDRVVLRKNPKYWGSVLPQNKGAYNFDKVVIRYIRDAQMAFENLKKGNLDYMPIRIGSTELWRQTKVDKAFVNKIKALKVSSKLQQGYGFLAFNLKNDLFKDKAVRKAIAKAINRKEMIRKSLDGLAVIPKGPLFSVDNFNGMFEPVTYDPASAYKDLVKLGWSDSDNDYILDKNGKKFSFTVLVPNARIEKELLYIQNDLKQIGIECVIKLVEYSTWRQLQDERKFDAISNGKGRTSKARGVDPYGEWHSNNIPTGLRNYYGYSDKRVDKLIVNARKELDRNKRKKLLDQVNDIVAEEYVMIQYSESKYSLHGVSSKIVMPKHGKTSWFPYKFGMKYWYKKTDV